MKQITKLKLASVDNICDALDKSVEYTLQLMQDTCNVDYETAVSYFSIPTNEREQLKKDVESLLSTISLLDVI